MIHRDGTVALTAEEISRECHRYMCDDTREDSRLLRLLNIVFLDHLGDEFRASLPLPAKRFVDLQCHAFREFETRYTSEREIVYAIYCGLQESTTEQEKETTTLPGLYASSFLHSFLYDFPCTMYPSVHALTNLDLDHVFIQALDRNKQLAGPRAQRPRGAASHPPGPSS